MTIDAPRNVAALRALWQEAFGDSDEFLDGFFTTAFSPQRCLCATEGDRLLGALYWFDATLSGKPVAYVYAVATAKESRGRGVCHGLMAAAHDRLKANGCQGVILVPGSENLFLFYEKMGYRVCSYVREKRFAASAAPVALRQVSAGEYAAMRRRLLPSGGVVQEGENLRFLQTQAKLYAAEDFALAATVKDGRLFAAEFLGEEALCPGILTALSCEDGLFRMPGQGKPFAMYKSLAGGELSPAYFGLAFD